MTILRCVKSQKSADIIYISAEAWNRGVFTFCTSRYFKWNCLCLGL